MTNSVAEMAAVSSEDHSQGEPREDLHTALNPADYSLAESPEYYRQINEFSLLSEEQECTLIERINQGDEEAFDTFVQANLRLVVFVARKFQGTPDHLGMDDLVNEGNIGLMRSLQKFDPEKGKFSTYAYKWIYATIDRAINNQDRTIRLPVNIEEKLAAARKIEAKLFALSGRDPATEEIAAKMKIEPEKLAEIKKAASKPKSLDSQRESEDGYVSSLKKITASPVEEPDAVLMSNERTALITAAIQDAIEALDEREQVVIQGRHGLVTEEWQTLKQLGKELGISRESVRQLQEAAEEKLLSGIVKSLDKFGIPIEDVVDMSRLEF